MTLKDSHNAISSLALGSGATPLAKPVGQTPAHSGPDLALANLSARQAKEMGLLTSATSGQLSFISSRSANLQSYLASRWQAIMASDGSTLYKLTWKARTTPQQRLIYALRGSARRTSGNASIGWPTPTARDGKGGYQGGRIRNGKFSTDTLDVTAQLAGWLTPCATNIPQRTPEGFQRRIDARLATGRASLSPGNLSEQVQMYCGDQLQTMPTPAGWPTPVADGNSRTPRPHIALTNYREDGTRHQQRLQDFAAIGLPVRLAASGEILTGSTAAMESGGQLNPELALWLMGFPEELASCAPTAIRS